ncbi:hypothetical protein LXL04_013250 [Taraxacum kok-saghyz]
MLNSGEPSTETGKYLLRKSQRGYCYSRESEELAEVEPQFDASIEPKSGTSKSNNKIKVTNAVILSTLWMIWKNRNTRTFNNIGFSPAKVLEDIKAMSFNRGKGFMNVTRDEH